MALGDHGETTMTKINKLAIASGVALGMAIFATGASHAVGYGALTSPVKVETPATDLMMQSACVINKPCPPPRTVVGPIRNLPRKR
jgi:hypothetical protein